METLFMVPGCIAVVGLIFLIEKYWLPACSRCDRKPIAVIYTEGRVFPGYAVECPNCSQKSYTYSNPFEARLHWRKENF